MIEFASRNILVITEKIENPIQNGIEIQVERSKNSMQGIMNKCAMHANTTKSMAIMKAPKGA